LEAVKWHLHRHSRELVAAGEERMAHCFFIDREGNAKGNTISEPRMDYKICAEKEDEITEPLSYVFIP
jgi:hypothetical protein